MTSEQIKDPLAPATPDLADMTTEQLLAELAEAEREIANPIKLKPHLKFIAFLAAIRGRDSYMIAEELGIPLSMVDRALKSHKVAAEIDRLQKETFNSVKDRVNQLALLGLQFYEDVMRGTITAGNKDKIAIVRDVHNRAFGKPIERVQVESQTIRQLFEQMDKFRQLPVAQPAERVQNNTKVIEGEATVVGDVGEPPSEVDAYLDDMTPHSGIGKGKVIDKINGQDG